MKEGISGHRTGLPKKLLDLFAPLEPLEQLTPVKKPKIKLPYTGLAQHISEFAEPGDPEYEPQQASESLVSSRLYANPELKAQSRLETETRLERYDQQKCRERTLALQSLTERYCRKQRLAKEKVAKASSSLGICNSLFLRTRLFTDIPCAGRATDRGRSEGVEPG